MGLYTFTGILGIAQWDQMPDADNLKLGLYLYDSTTDKWYIVTSNKVAVKENGFTRWKKHQWSQLDEKWVPAKLRATALLVPS